MAMKPPKFGWLMVAAAFLWPSPCRAQESKPPIEVEVAAIGATGPAVRGMESFDRMMRGLMAKWRIPGGALAVSKNGRLVFARGYGWADREAKEAVQPDSLFRIASISKTITAAAIVKLVEKKQLDLDTPAFNILDDLQAPDGATIDERLKRVTVRQLLHHSGGWDRAQSIDPIMLPHKAAQVFKTQSPGDTNTLIRYMMGQPLQFDPGTRYAYSNFGYNILGQIIEKVSGQTYEDYVRTHILQPASANRMRVAKTTLAGRVVGEVKYFDAVDAGSSALETSDKPQKKSQVYSQLPLETLAASSGWIASPIDLLRFIHAIDDRNERSPVFGKAAWQWMTSRPDPPLWVDSAHYYAAGCLVRPIGGDANIWHGGAMTGTSSLLVRAANGLSWAVLFNVWPPGDDFAGELDKGCWDAVGGVTAWPQHDLFDQFASVAARP